MAVQSRSSEAEHILEDMVSEICKHQGLEVQTRATRQVEGEKHTIDVLATRESEGETEQVAFECAYFDRPADADDVVAFHTKLQALGIRNGVFVCSGGFTPRAEYRARDLGIELWNLSMLNNRMQGISVGEKNTIDDTLPLDPLIVEHATSSKIVNFSRLRLVGIPKLEIRPYHFVDFHAETLGGPIQGFVVVDGVEGTLADSWVSGKGDARLAHTGAFVECKTIEPRTGVLPSLPADSNLGKSLGQPRARVEREKALSLAKAEVAKGLLADPTRGHEVVVEGSRTLHIPIVSVQFVGVGGKTYERIVQGATGRIIFDQTSFCEKCGQLAKAICEVCGKIVCSSHLRRCDRCLQPTCDSSGCNSEEGILSKNLRCANCRSGRNP